MIQDEDTLVVARYNEDLTWIANSDVAKYCIVYKGKPIDNEMRSRFKDVYKIPHETIIMIIHSHGHGVGHLKRID